MKDYRCLVITPEQKEAMLRVNDALNINGHVHKPLTIRGILNNMNEKLSNKEMSERQKYLLSGINEFWNYKQRHPIIQDLITIGNKIKTRWLKYNRWLERRRKWRP